MPVELRDRFDRVVQGLASRVPDGIDDRTLYVADVGTAGRVYVEVVRETGQMVVAEYVLSSAAAEAA
jgi:hypothetical protein